MPRTLLGILALFILATSISLSIWYPSDAASKAWIAAAIRIGAMLGIIWLAHPQLKHMSPGVWIAILLMIIVAARFRYVALMFVVILVGMAILRPRHGRAEP